MMPAEDITAIILAGGDSRRYGSDKATAPFRGRSMIEWVYSAVEPLAVSVLVSTRGTSPLPEVPAVADLYQKAGPLAGLHAGICAASTPWVLAVACDLPLLTTQALGLLLAECEDGIEAVVARETGGRQQPLCACYRTTIRPQVESLLDSGPVAMAALLDRLYGVRFVGLPDAVLKNVNRRSDAE